MKRSYPVGLTLGQFAKCSFFAAIWLCCLASAGAAEGKLGTNVYYNDENRYRIVLPEGWSLIKPNKTFTQVKASAPTGYAVISVACRDGLWKDDASSRQYSDAWSAFDGMGLETFTNRFERGVPNQVADILNIGKATLGKEKAINVDYYLTDTTKGTAVRIRSFFVLHGDRWFSISCATSKHQPDLFLGEMLKAAKSFEFD